jgi:hypothetical protein
MERPFDNFSLLNERCRMIVLTLGAAVPYVLVVGMERSI